MADTPQDRIRKVRRHSPQAAGHRLPARDAPILAAAIVSRSAVLVTGDRRDFGALFGKIIDGVEILPPGEAVHAVLG
ncbi:MAG: hypothetical protein L6Q83_09065 [Gammaproteobacteria bacterium]|nr:hypothetical protein [Gammaproteobacteria bacterium]